MKYLAMMTTAVILLAIWASIDMRLESLEHSCSHGSASDAAFKQLVAAVPYQQLGRAK